jgi:DNA invertase Pin-like site-specific DNA recombinase
MGRHHNGRMLLRMLGGLAEFERDLIRVRTGAGRRGDALTTDQLRDGAEIKYAKDGALGGIEPPAAHTPCRRSVFNN